MSLSNMLDEYIAAEKKFQENAQEAMKAAFQEVFDFHPEITAFRWTQYTPYFNDGEECTFRIADVFVTNFPLDDEELWEGAGAYEYDSDREDVYTWGEDDRDLPFFFTNQISGTHYRKDVRIGPAVFDGKDISKLENLINALNSDAMEHVLKGTFGNHVQITATRNGFDIEEYDHD